MSELRTNRIIPRDGLPSGSAGGIIQVRQILKTDSFYTTSQTYTDITGMNISITPTRSDSKILLQCNLQFGGQINLYAPVRLLRDSTHIGQSTVYSGNQTNATFSLNLSENADQYKIFSSVYQILDSPSTTSAVTYKLQMYVAEPGWTTRVNRSQSTANDRDYGRGASSITVMEIAA